jgi:arylsulfatase A
MARRLAIAELCSALLALLCASTVEAQPNVVVIVADDLGYGDLGSYGSPDALTPHLNALAARGLRFTDFYGGPVCTPSRYSLLTGLHAFRAGDTDLLEALEPADTDSGIDDEAVTIAEAMRAEGYETAMIGKWHLGAGDFLFGAPDTEYHPLHHGFGRSFGSLSGAIDYSTHYNRAGSGPPFLDWWEDRTPRPQDDSLYATYAFGERAVDFLRARAKVALSTGAVARPFLLYLPFTAPHAGRVQGSNPADALQLPIGREREYLSRFDHLYPSDQDVRKRYLAMLAVLDDEVGRIVDALEANGLADETVVWFVSDNGGKPLHGGSSGGLRGEKGTPYEGGIRVPSFVVWPGHIAPGVTGQLGTNVDVLPTVLALAGLTPPPSLDGLDLSTHLLGGPVLERGVAVPNSISGDAVRLGRWKYVRRYRTDGTPRVPELYDLTNDPTEASDLSAVYPDTVAALQALLPY